MSLLLSLGTLSSLNSGPTPILCTPLASLFPIRDLQSSKGQVRKLINLIWSVMNLMLVQSADISRYAINFIDRF